MQPLIASLVCGWLLFSPPFGPDKKLDPSRPLSEWTQIKAFDRAIDCEGFRIRMARDPAEGISQQAPFVRCIPSDSIKYQLQ